MLPRVLPSTSRKKSLDALLILASAFAIGKFFSIALRRAKYPFELEWMEGGILEHALRLREGLDLYGQPTLEWTPFLYNPLYYALGAGSTLLFGKTLFALRVVSILATLACFLLTYAIAARTVRSFEGKVLAVGLFAATYPLSGHWLDLARIDSLAHALSLGALLAALPSESAARSEWRAGLSGALLALAFFTKQSALLVLPALLTAFALRKNWRGLVVFSFVAGLLAALGLFWLHRTSHGWYWYYALELPLSHSDKGREYLKKDFFQLEMFGPLPFLATLAFVGASRHSKRLLSEAENHAHRIVVGAAVLWVASAYVTRRHMGSFVNDLIPMHSALSLLAAVGYERLRTRALGAPVTIALLVQFALLFSINARVLPTARDRAAGDRLVERLRALDGSVLVFHHPHLARAAGKPGHAHAMALIDIEASDGDPRGARTLLRRNVLRSLTSGAFRHVVLDDFEMIFGREIRQNYLRGEQLSFDGDELQPLTGTRSRPVARWTFRGTEAPPRPSSH